MALRLMPYYGSKARIAKRIIAHFPPHVCYVEPFGGSAAVLLNKPRSQIEFYNDLDGRMVNLFRVLRDPGQAAELARLVALTPYARREWECRNENNDGDEIENARRLLVAAWQSWGEGGATAQWNVGWSRAKTPGWGRGNTHWWADLPQVIGLVVERMRGVQIESRAAVDLLNELDGEGTLFYLDPPYPAEVRSKWGRVAYRYEMNDAEHELLAKVVHGLRGKVVISSYRGLYDALYADWATVEITTQTSQNGRAVEVLYLSPNCQGQLALGI